MLKDRGLDRINELDDFLAKPRNQREEIDALNELAWELRVSQPARVRTLCQKADELSRTGDFSGQPYAQGLAASMVGRAFVDTYDGKLDTAFSQCLQALSLLQGMRSNVEVQVWFTLGWNSFFLGDYPAALENGMKALNMARELNDHLHEAWALDAVASFHGITGDFKAAIRLHEDALKIFNRLSDAFGELRTLNNLAVSLLEMKHYEHAYDAGERSLQLARAYDLEMDICNNSCTVVDVLIEMKRYDDAGALLQDAVSRTFHGSNVAHVHVLERAGRLRLLKGDLDGAEQYVARALEVAQKLDQRAEQALCHRTLSEIREQKGDLVDALINYKKFHEIHDTVQGEQAEKRLEVLKITHQVESAQYAAEIYRLETVELQRKVEEQKAVQDVLEIQTTIDPLTELHNRRYFDDALLKEYSRHSRSGAEMSVLMLDVDYFKQYNDTYGHVSGDDCLRQIAQVIRDSTSRPPDITARYGGEEFVCLLPETDLDGARHVAESIHKRIGELAIPHSSSSAAAYVTVSVGAISSKCVKGGSATELLIKADEQLYLAKSRGRNRVEVVRI